MSSRSSKLKNQDRFVEFDFFSSEKSNGFKKIIYSHKSNSFEKLGLCLNLSKQSALIFILFPILSFFILFFEFFGIKIYSKKISKTKWNNIEFFILKIKLKKRIFYIFFGLK